MSDEQRPVPDRRARRRRLIVGVVVAAVLVVVALVVGSAAVWAVFLRGPHVAPGQQVRVEIPQGADTAVIARRLVNAGVVHNENTFRLRSRLDGADGRFKAGVYAFTTGSDYEAVILRLEEGPNSTNVTVTIPEGFTIHQIAQRLASKAGIPASEFEHVATTQASEFKPRYPFLASDATPSLEGYLFPKTYVIKRGMKAADVVDMMLEQFGEETAGLDLGYATSKNLSLHDVVTIASIVEREAVISHQRPLVASVVYNRLQRHMFLGLDSVLGYVLGQKAHLSSADLQTESAYNTYRHKGLPPTPIANPGLASLRAAAHPTPSAYLYFVGTAKDGSLTFTVTYADFLKAKAVSKKVLGQ